MSIHLTLSITEFVYSTVQAGIENISSSHLYAFGTALCSSLVSMRLYGLFDGIVVFRANDWFKFLSVSLSLLWIHLLLPVRMEIFNVFLVLQKCNPILPNTRRLYSNFELRSIIAHTSFAISPFFLFLLIFISFDIIVKLSFVYSVITIIAAVPVSGCRTNKFSVCQTDGCWFESWWKTSFSWYI